RRHTRFDCDWSSDVCSSDLKCEDVSLSHCSAAVLASVLTASVATAAEQWLKLKSSHFELYTTAGEKKGREAILYFEQVRDFFSRARSSNEKLISDASVHIIAFRSEKEFKPYRINDSAAAYYLSGYDRDYI